MTKITSFLKKTLAFKIQKKICMPLAHTQQPAEIYCCGKVFDFTQM